MLIPPGIYSFWGETCCHLECISIVKLSFPLIPFFPFFLCLVLTSLCIVCLEVYFLKFILFAKILESVCLIFCQILEALITLLAMPFSSSPSKTLVIMMFYLLFPYVPEALFTFFFSNLLSVFHTVSLVSSFLILFFVFCICYLFTH